MRRIFPPKDLEKIRMRRFFKKKNLSTNCNSYVSSKKRINKAIFCFVYILIIFQYIVSAFLISMVLLFVNIPRPLTGKFGTICSEFPLKTFSAKFLRGSSYYFRRKPFKRHLVQKKNWETPIYLKSLKIKLE